MRPSCAVSVVIKGLSRCHPSDWSPSSSGRLCPVFPCVFPVPLSVSPFLSSFSSCFLSSHFFYFISIHFHPCPFMSPNSFNDLSFSSHFPLSFDNHFMFHSWWVSLSISNNLQQFFPPASLSLFLLIIVRERLPQHSLLCFASIVVFVSPLSHFFGFIET